MLFFIGIIAVAVSFAFGLYLFPLALLVIFLSHSSTSSTLPPPPLTYTSTSQTLPPSLPPPTTQSYEIKTQKAKEMRNNPTPAEKRMHDILNSSVVPNFPEHLFYSQSVQYGYILDFYCPTLKLA